MNLPTKQHWRNPSKLEWIRDGLQDLKKFLVDNNVRSIAVPALGSGNGGLDWQIVKPVIQEALDALPGVEVTVYEPGFLA